MKYNNFIYFSFEAEFFDTYFITQELNIEPTSVKRKNDPVPKFTSWVFQIDIGDQLDLENPLEKIIEIFEPKILEINDLKEKYNLKTSLIFVIHIDINPDSSTPSFPLNMRAIDFLSKTNTIVDFDLYKTDST